jgi:hypothetical protein
MSLPSRQQSRPFAQHIMATNGWNDWILNSIHWDSQAKALSTQECTQELFVTKWVHNLLRTRRHHMKPIEQAESDLRPSCLATVETAPRIFACPKRVPWQVVFLDSLCKLLAKPRTQPELQMILMVGIQGALQDNPLFGTPTRNREPSLFKPLVSTPIPRQSTMSQDACARLVSSFRPTVSRPLCWQTTIMVTLSAPKPLATCDFCYTIQTRSPHKTTLSTFSTSASAWSATTSMSSVSPKLESTGSSGTLGTDATRSFATFGPTPD